jgi:gamma-glutamylcyclotransferase (GGCT)/AIG2-like uncharacterized protein YtfP
VNATGPGPRHLFVYGTLRRGDVRWQLLEPYVATPEPTLDEVDGSLYDTGNDYPAARFGTGGTIRGEVFEIAAARLDACLSHMDEVEGTVAGLYRRLALTTVAGVAVWAYEYGEGLGLTPILSGDWLEHRPLAG